MYHLSLFVLNKSLNETFYIFLNILTNTIEIDLEFKFILLLTLTKNNFVKSQKTESRNKIFLQSAIVLY